MDDEILYICPYCDEDCVEGSINDIIFTCGNCGESMSYNKLKTSNISLLDKSTYNFFIEVYNNKPNERIGEKYFYHPETGYKGNEVQMKRYKKQLNDRRKI